MATEEEIQWVQAGSSGDALTEMDSLTSESELGCKWVRRRKS